MYCHGNYGPVGGLGYWLLFTGHWARCTVFSMSWGPHGPEPALWGANNGMHTTLHNVQWTDICTNLTLLTGQWSLSPCRHWQSAVYTSNWTLDMATGQHYIVKWILCSCAQCLVLSAQCSVWSPALFFVQWWDIDDSRMCSSSQLFGPTLTKNETWSSASIQFDCEANPAKFWRLTLLNRKYRDKKGTGPSPFSIILEFMEVHIAVWCVCVRKGAL